MVAICGGFVLRCGLLIVHIAGIWLSRVDQQSLPGIEMESMEVVDQEHAAERRLFEEVLGEMPFGDAYLALLDEGWYWRDAAYIAWRGMPKQIRQPATLTELANVLGCGRRTITARRSRNAAIDVRAAKMVFQATSEKIDDVLDALWESASEANYKNHPDRKLALEMMGLYTPRQALSLEDGRVDEDLGDLSEEELRRMARIDSAPQTAIEGVVEDE